MRESSPFRENDSSVSPVTAEEMRQQLDRLLHSATLSSSTILRKLLRYVGVKAIEGNCDEIKEYIIGREVLGRRPDFDPRIDPAVRVDAHRLREKLEEYYRNEGSDDEIALEIPKGHYVPRFSRRNPADLKHAFPFHSHTLSELQECKEPGGHGFATRLSETSPGHSTANESARSFPWRILLIFPAILFFVGAGLMVRRTVVAGTWMNWLDSPARADVKSPSNPDLRNFWAHFLKAKSPPIVTYSNAIFLVTRSSDLLRLKADSIDTLGAPATPGMARRLVANPSLLSQAGPVFFEDVYTGTGEVMAVYYLTQMFDTLHRSIEVERSRLVSIDDLRTHDVIFLGSTREDSLLASLPVKDDFVFKWPDQPTRVWDGKILDLHPRRGSRSSYQVERDVKTGALRADYALISVHPGIIPGRKVVVLGGLTTLGTQGAAEFATSPEGVSEISSKLGFSGSSSPDSFPPYFQAVLKVSIMKGEVLNTHCICVHVIHTGPVPSTHDGF